MTEQSFERHGHHPVATYVASVFGLVAIICVVGAWLADWATLEVGAVSLSLAVATLISISRNYTVRLQDRIIALEMKVRCAEVLPAGQDARLAELTPKQIVALRFASDEELGELLERAIREQLPPKEIKRAIKRWRPDYLRT
ncbi:MAG TPA: DUF6526 family protein [Vicinamibacterales bacterium]|nr:DUF6526 family protein [Vicinamibacterales bacterium]